MTINDDDAVPGTLQFDPTTVSAGEGAGTATFTVTRTGGSDGAVSVDYAVTGGTAAGSGTDYTLANGTLSFGNGETTKTITVAIVNDSLYEPNETVVVTLSNATGGASIGTNSSATLTINDDDAALPAISSITASNSGNNPGLGADDKVEITFDHNTNKPAITAATIDSKLKLNNGHSWGTALQDADIAWNAAGNKLTITFSNVTGSTITVGDTITLDISANIKDSGSTTAASTSSSSLTGTFTSVPAISSITASNSGSNTGLGIGDTVVITFDQNTNKPSITAATIDSKLKLNNGHSWGTALQDADIAWNAAGNKLTITFSNVTGSTITVGDTITLDTAANIKDSGATTAASTHSGSITGTFTNTPISTPPAPETTSTVEIKVNGKSEQAATATTTIVENKTPFSDVSKSDWFYGAVEFANRNGLFAGTGADTFSPNSPMTRAMLWTVLGRLDGQSLSGSGVFDAARSWAMGAGITDGTNPDGSITREQMVTILWRYAGSPKAGGDLSNFVDAGSVASYAENAMAWAVEKGVVAGANGALMPQDNATRAQVAAILQRFIEGMAK